jgi:hypothetical protein
MCEKKEMYFSPSAKKCVLNKISHITKGSREATMKQKVRIYYKSLET